jgi:hypothetical protein
LPVSAVEVVGEAAVLAEQVADLPRADVDVAGGDIRGGADVPVQLAHERLAETHDLGSPSAPGIEIGAALGAAHRQARERVLEGLLEGEEFEHGLGDRGVEADATLVGPDHAAVLHAPAPVDHAPRRCRRSR